MDKSTQECQEWYKVREKGCLINHKGSSDAMEAAGATEIFLWSLEKHNLKYKIKKKNFDSEYFGHVYEKLQDVYGEEFTIQR